MSSGSIRLLTAGITLRANMISPVQKITWRSTETAVSEPGHAREFTPVIKKFASGSQKVTS